jgi:hypothetical protein
MPLKPLASWPTLLRVLTTLKPSLLRLRFFRGPRDGEQNGAAPFVSGYIVLVDNSTRYAVQAETQSDAEHRVRDAIGQLGERVDATRKLTSDEMTTLQLNPGEVRLHPAEHG